MLFKLINGGWLLRAATSMWSWLLAAIFVYYYQQLDFRFSKYSSTVSLKVLSTHTSLNKFIQVIVFLQRIVRFIHAEQLSLTIPSGKKSFTQFSTRMAAWQLPTFFICLQKSVKHYTLYYHIIKSTDIWKRWFIKLILKTNGCSFQQALRQI